MVEASPIALRETRADIGAKPARQFILAGIPFVLDERHCLGKTTRQTWDMLKNDLADVRSIWPVVDFGVAALRV
jgi:hypothetical protein